MLRADNLKKSIELCHLKYRLREHWNRLRVLEVSANTSKPLGVRERLTVTAKVSLGDLKAEELRVQLYVGQLDNDGQITNGQSADLRHTKDLGNGVHEFIGDIPINTSGRHGYAIRIIPGSPLFEGIYEPGLIFWDNMGEQAAPATTHAA